MWLQATRWSNLIHREPNDYVSSWRVDAVAHSADGLEPYTVGRISADELRRYEIVEWGEDVWDVADADSSGLEAAWTSLLDKDGDFREDDFDGPANPVVYLYRFRLHDDFAGWRMAVLDACCRIFGDDALVLAQRDTTWFSEAEFEMVGFDLLPPSRSSSPADLLDDDLQMLFMMRDNTCRRDFELADYPRDAPPARKEHAEWLEGQGPWQDLV